MTVPRQSGVALAIVLWFLAGMSLLVSGIVYQARNDTRMAQLHFARATAVSAGDGAIVIMLAKLVSRDSSKSPDNSPISESFMVGTHAVSVELVSTSGLIDLKGASAKTLARLFAALGHLTNAEAQILADNVIEWRDRSKGALSGAPADQFQSPEDVLQVMGITRTLWDAIRDAVVVNNGISSDVPDIAAAPQSVRAVFAEEAPAARANADVPGKRVGASSGLANSYRVDAVVRYGGRAWLRRKWVDLGGDSTQRLPWKFTRIEAPRVLPDP